ncbi:SHOCT domain-containing protein [Glutamicibacter sp. JL.03c]|uniref:SHOCT domain-containing protein n=1 Tax=Glutamicibacter sp. JL.03c TaxID=2984842 RepID=UPI0021F7EF7E|nr:SHOCT domain-containing protein [Glutamicibacter sp. JL.03c]UYQ78391.1 SHOCT domain-containing protein [Glutamicibacter sp. JL.03c]
MKNSEVIYGYDESLPADESSFGYIEDDLSTGSSFIDATFSVMPILIGLVAVFLVSIVISIVFAQARNSRNIKSAGMDPITFETDLKTKLAQSNLLAAKQSLEAKLEELTSLRSRGILSNDEYVQARQDLLKGWSEG